MIGTHFDHFRKILLDPTPQGIQKREDVKAIYFGIKVAAGTVFTASALVGTSAVISSIAAPILGGITALWAGVGCVLSSEVFIIADNVVKMCSDDFYNFLSRCRDVIKPDWFVASVLKNTWVAQPFFSSFLIEQLNRPIHD